MDLKGRRSNPLQRRLSPTDIDHYREGATIGQLAADFGVHRTMIAGHLDRPGVPRRSERTAWDDEILNEAVELYAAASSLAKIADQFGIDARIVANRFQRGWILRDHSTRQRR